MITAPRSRTPAAGLRRAVAAALVLTASAPLAAHEVPLRVGVMAYVRADGPQLRVIVRVPLEAIRDVQFPLRGDGSLDLARLAPLLPGAARQWVADYLELFADDRPLAPDTAIVTQLSLPSDRSYTSWDAALAHATGAPLARDTDVRWQQAMLDIVIRYPIDSDRSRFAIRPALAHLGVRTTTVLRFLTHAGDERVFEYAGNPGLVELDPRWSNAAWRFVQLGFRHILGGFDHLLFVFCLVLPLRRWRPLLAIITAFSVAHSITLVAAAAGFAPRALWFPPLVETLVAGSIVWMALENILRPADALAHRWRMAFVFGLVHGFGFSFALRDSLQFSGRHLATALAAFNLGVEAGQVVVVAALVPALAWSLLRLPRPRLGVGVLSALVAHSAWHWMVERGRVLSAYRLALPAIDAAFWLGITRGALLLGIAGVAAWGCAALVRRIGGATPSRVLAPMALVALLLGSARSGGAQGVTAPRRTTRDGVYTVAQATLGRDLYAGLCQSCHTAASHTGAPFRANWVGRPLSDLLAYIVNLMPKSAPGTLSEDEATLLLAYILRMNGLPAGSEPLTADTTPLHSVRIELADVRPAPSAPR